jgi:hypothetical protein
VSSDREAVIRTIPNKQWRQLAREFLEAGGQISTTGSGHLRWVTPQGGVVFSSKTTSDRRAIKSHTSQLRKHGWERA